MKTLLFIDSLGSGGAQRQMITLAKMLKEQAIDVEFLCYFREDFFLPILEDEGIMVHWVIESNNLKRIWKIRNFIRKGNYDAVISFLDTPNFLNNIAAIGGKKWKVITSERSSKEDFFLTRRGKLFGWFQRYSDTIVCNSDNAKNMWKKYYPSYENKLTTIYNAVHLLEVQLEYIPKKHGKLHIVVAASYQYLKNPIGLIQALLLLDEDDRKKIHIDWYGRVEVVDGDTRAYDEAIELIKGYDLQNMINFYSETIDIHDKMNSADIVALFSKLEGLPNTICEGMMLGKPIVMTKVSDYKTLVDESNGFLCDWDHPRSIKDALVKAINLSNKDLLRMGNVSRNRANFLFSKVTVSEKWYEIINE